MTKDFLKMTSAERDVEAKKLDREFSFDKTRPLSARGQWLWESAKRGRPRKPAGEKSKRILISIEPRLLAMIEAFSAANGVDQSKLFALGAQAFIASDGAHRQAAVKDQR